MRLEDVVRDDETLLRSFICCSPSPLLERTLLGSGVQHLRLAIAGITTKRIILIGINRDQTFRGCVSQIAWGDVKSATIATVRRSMVLTFRNGTKQRFSDLTFADAKELREIVPPLVGQGPMSASKERERLCGACLNVLRPGSASCPNCHAPMKRRDRATRLASWSSPAGYFYLGFTPMALLAGLMDVIFFAAFLLSGYAALQRHLFGTTALLCVTVLFLEWKALVIAHTTSLANETALDFDSGGMAAALHISASSRRP